jgi:glycosyltransferase involved in cell wall biosynthesis
MLLPAETLRDSGTAARKPSIGLSNLYDVVFVLNINSKGWILEKICKVIARHLGLRTTIIFTERNNTVTGWLPAARSYFFSHYKIYMGALNSGILPADSKTYVWFTHPSFSAGNTVEAFVTALNQCTTIFTANSFHAGALAFLGVEPGKLKTILGGADPEHFQSRPRKGIRVGIVGAYYERKNPDLLLDVIRSMRDVEFLLIAPHPSEVENKSLLWENWKRFPDLLDLPNFQYISARFDEFGEHYAQMDVYLSLSKLEGGPIPLIEAMFANRFPVVTRTGFAEDIVKDGVNGLLLPVATTVDEVAIAIRVALSDRTTDISASVADFSWDNFGRNFRDAIDPGLPIGRSISFASTDARVTYLRDGWGEQDSAGVWLSAKAGTLRFRVAPDTKTLVFSFHAQATMGLEGVPLRMLMNGRVVEEAIFESGPHVRELPLSSEDAGSALMFRIELTAVRPESLGTICLESLVALGCEAVVDAPDSSGLVHSKWDVAGPFEGSPVFDVPVIILGTPDQPQARQVRRALQVELGIPTLPDNGHFEPGWDGIAIVDGVDRARLLQFDRVDGMVARSVDEKIDLLQAAPDVPAIVIPEVVSRPLISNVANLEPSIAAAVIFAEHAGQDEDSFAWICDLLTEKGIIFKVSESAASAEGEHLTDARSAVASAAEGADLCFFSGAERELPFIANCLAMGIPVLIYGPSELYPALAAHGLRYLFIQNRSRLAKTLSMLAEPRARSSIALKFERLLESSRGLQAATERYASFARGLIDQRTLSRSQPNVGVLCAAPFNGEDVAHIAAAISMLLDLGCRVCVLIASRAVEIPMSHPNLEVTYLGEEAGAASTLGSPLAKQRLATGIREQRPDLLLCFSESSLSFAKAAQQTAQAVFVAGVSTVGAEDGSPSSLASIPTIAIPRLLAPRLSSAVLAAIGKDRAGARKQLGFRPDEVIVFCVSDGSGPHDQRVADALEIARESGRPIRFVIESADHQPGGGILGRLRKKTRTTVEISNVASDQVDLALRSADLALITAPPNDATIVSRALMFGLPIIGRSDVRGSDLLGPRVSGTIFDVDDRECFENDLKALLADEPLRRKLSAQARATYAGILGHDDMRLGFATGIVRALSASSSYSPQSEDSDVKH